jgi:uncharacterized membrane protein
MKSVRLSVLVLAVLCVCFFGYLTQTLPELPATVATHFGGAGRPNGWMSHRGYAIFTGVFAVGVPALIVGSCALVGVMPKRTINIPHRDYWLAPERYRQTGADMLRYGLWFACLMVAFLGGVHWLIVEANRQSPAHLSPPAILSLMAGFLVGLGLWMLTVVRRFRKPA